MGCECPCGNGYGFRPLGFWVCHRCGSVNDSGPVGSGKRRDVMDPDRVDELVRNGTEFAGHADASVRDHPGSWEAWYSLAATYAARGNILEASLILIRVAELQTSPEDLRAVLDRGASLLSNAIVGTTVGGGRCNNPSLYGLERIAMEGLGEDESFCWRLYGRLIDSLDGLGPREAFVIRNLACIAMTQRMAMVPDIRDHAVVLRRLLEDSASGKTGKRSINPLKMALAKKSAEYSQFLSEPYAEALRRVEDAIGSTDSSARLDELASVQPRDGSAGFVKMLSDGLGKGVDVAYLRATKSDASEVDAVRREMNSLLDSYVSMFMSGDTTPSPEGRACIEIHGGPVGGN